MTNKYVFLPHTADAKFQAWGHNMEEAFMNAAYAMADVITDHSKIEPIITKRIKITSENQESLLYDFLEHFLFLLDTKRFFLSEIKKIKIIAKKNKFLLIASVIGDGYHVKYPIKTTIKAVTYQEMFVKHERNKVTVQVVVDI